MPLARLLNAPGMFLPEVTKLPFASIKIWRFIQTVNVYIVSLSKLKRNADVKGLSFIGGRIYLVEV